MNLIKFLLFVLINISIFFSNTYAKDNFAFINLDKIIKKSNYGKNILNEIQIFNNSNIEKLKVMESELSQNENELNKKKNILSDSEFKKEVEKLKKKKY